MVFMVFLFFSVTFTMNNIGEVDAPFRWNVPAPFSLEPSSGIIPAMKSLDIIVRISPEDASVFVGEASCLVGEGAEHSSSVVFFYFLFFFFFIIFLLLLIIYFILFI